MNKIKHTLQYHFDFFNNKSGLPPMFSDSFREMGPDWNEISGINFEITGRVLVSHLILEHYITKLIELKTPKDFNWDESRLTFSQKVNLLKKDEVLNKTNYIKGIEILNKIRNKFSHNLLAVIDLSNISELTKIINDRSSSKTPIINKKHDPIEVINAFASLACSYIGGYCTFLVHSEQQKKNKPLVENKKK